jgi:uncharacterized protein YaaR (DUF327 family)
MLRSEYIKRKNDIDEFFTILNFIDGVETNVNGRVFNGSIGKNITVNRQMQQCLRAEFILVLYNAIESTFSNCIYYVFDAIKDSGLNYFDLREELRKIWIKEQIKPNTSLDKIRKKLKSIADNVISNNVVLEELPSDISGNLDMRKIASLSNSMGNNLGCIPNSNETGTILLKIKTERNNLGHGNKTFSSVGAELTINDLEKYKNIVIAFLDYIIEKFESYVADKKYKV